MNQDDQYVIKKNPDRIYFSKEFPVKTLGGIRGARFVSQVFEENEREAFLKVNDEIVLRRTSSGRQEIKAFFLVDNRKTARLTLQRFSTDREQPRKEAYFTLQGDEIAKLFELLLIIRTAKFDAQDKVRLDSKDLHQFSLTPKAIRTLLTSDPQLLVSLVEEEVTDRDLIAVAYRRRELDYFNRLLHDPEFFLIEKKTRSFSRDEDLWQSFFERNPWIFGYGLFYVFASSLEERKLEQIVAGSSLAGAGKRVDALLKTRGRISSLCFAEIKTHRASLLEGNQYRPKVWSPSRELVAAIAQVQKTVDRAEQTIGSRLDVTDSSGNPTGENAFLIRPRSIVVIGNLEEFQTDHGINEPKYRSFELFRRQVVAPEILTFDELYERAHFIVESTALDDSI
jgi:hypothetical protein